MIRTSGHCSSTPCTYRAQHVSDLHASHLGSSRAMAFASLHHLGNVLAHLDMLLVWWYQSEQLSMACCREVSMLSTEHPDCTFTKTNDYDLKRRRLLEVWRSAHYFIVYIRLSGSPSSILLHPLFHRKAMPACGLEEVSSGPNTGQECS